MVICTNSKSLSFGIANTQCFSIFLLPPIELPCRLWTEKVNDILQSNIILIVTTNCKQYLICLEGKSDSKGDLSDLLFSLADLL